jgi:hypothetical protein
VIHEVGPVGDVIAELWKEAQKHHVLDFDKRSGISLNETAYQEIVVGEVN